MEKREDPRLDATRTLALDNALAILQDKGMPAVTHGGISRATGISRSTLYRHWPKLDDLRNATIARATVGAGTITPPNGPLRADLMWIFGTLTQVLNETPWGKIAPQVIAAAAIEDQTRDLLRNWIEGRTQLVRTVFDAAIARGEVSADAPVAQLIELAIAGPYFRKLVAGLALDQAWLHDHVEMLCAIATKIDHAGDRQT